MYYHRLMETIDLVIGFLCSFVLNSPLNLSVPSMMLQYWFLGTASGVQSPLSSVVRDTQTVV